jgi:3'-phosphoadenosine 5'-phosphosulfate (PAPS) 3'-phosphatase
VQLSYPPGSAPARCPVTGKLWGAESKAHKAWQQQQQSELQQPTQQQQQSQQQQAIQQQQPAQQQQSEQTQHQAQELLGASGHSRSSHATFTFYQEHKGHKPGSIDSIKYLPIHEVPLVSKQ